MYVVRKSDRLWHKHTIQTEFYNDVNHPQQIYVALRPVQDFSEPDLLLYWAKEGTADKGTSGSALPAQAKLLAAIRSDALVALPEDAKQGGQLVLYSVAHQAIVDAAVVERLP
jgi:hypothetical protein